MTGNQLKKEIKKKSLTQEEAAHRLGVTRRTLHNWFSLEKLDANISHNVKENLGIEIGEHAIKKGSIKTEARDLWISNFTYVPLVGVRAKAGYLFGYGDPEYVENLPTIPVITDNSFRGKYRCFEVEGDSMDDGTRDALCDKDIVLCREVKKDLWRYKLHYRDWNFVIVHKDGILIKRIVDQDVEKCIVTCHSINPFYGEDFQIDLHDAYELYNVIKIVDRSAKI